MQEPEWDTTTLYISATTLKKGDEPLDNAELAKRLSEAIIETVTKQKIEGWEPMGMEFHNGEVTLNFRRMQTTSIKP